MFLNVLTETLSKQKSKQNVDLIKSECWCDVQLLALLPVGLQALKMYEPVRNKKGVLKLQKHRLFLKKHMPNKQ